MFCLDLFEKNVLNTIEKYSMILKGDRIVVGLSGGADSSVLLTVLKIFSEIIGFKLCAAHLNHGIRGDEAKRDMEFSYSLAKKLNIPFYAKSVSVPEYAEANHISEEMAGRILRYDFFDEICKEHSYNKIAVAHNKNDSAETVIMNLIRGSGSNGLSGIAAKNRNIIRPLLESDRTNIEKYAKNNNIDYVTDSTNNCNIYTRNIVRNKILPNLTCINSGALNNIVRCSNIIFSENEFIEQYAQKLNAVNKCDNAVFIDKEIFDLQHIAIKRKLIYEAVKCLKGNTLNFSSTHTESIISGCKTGAVIKMPCGISVVFEYDKIVFSKDLLNIPDYEYKVTLPGKLTVKETNMTYSFEILENINELNFSVNQYIKLDDVDITNVILRTKNDGDVFSPSGMQGSKKIKKFFIDNKIPKQERNKYPLLILNDEVAAVLSLRVASGYTIDKKTQKILKITMAGGNNE